LAYAVDNIFVSPYREQLAVCVLGWTVNLCQRELDIVIAAESRVLWIRVLPDSGFDHRVLASHEFETTAHAITRLPSTPTKLLVWLPNDTQTWRITLKTRKQTDILYNDSFVDARTYSISAKLQETDATTHTICGLTKIRKTGLASNI
jgi:hypothetical protein